MISLYCQHCAQMPADPSMMGQLCWSRFNCRVVSLVLMMLLYYHRGVPLQLAIVLFGELALSDLAFGRYIGQVTNKYQPSRTQSLIYI